MAAATTRSGRKLPSIRTLWAIAKSPELGLTDEDLHGVVYRQRRKIYALTEALGWNSDKRRIEGFVKRMTGIDRLEWLDAGQCEKVIEGLKAILAREQRKEGADGRRDK